MSTSDVTSVFSLNNQEQLNSLNISKNNDAQLVQTLLVDNNNNSSDTVNVDLNQIYKGLTVLAQKVLERLQEVIGNDTPGGVYNLKPEDHTAEKTADTIVKGTTGLLSIFARQHNELKGEELISEFMKTIRSGIEKGYKDAESILGDIGAFDIDGVKSGIDQTKKLVEEKLKAFEDNYRKQNGLTADSQATTETKSAVLNQAASTVAAN